MCVPVYLHGAVLIWYISQCVNSKSTLEAALRLMLGYATGASGAATETQDKNVQGEGVKRAIRSSRSKINAFSCANTLLKWQTLPSSKMQFAFHL